MALLSKETSARGTGFTCHLFGTWHLSHGALVSKDLQIGRLNPSAFTRKLFQKRALLSKETLALRQKRPRLFVEREKLFRASPWDVREPAGAQRTATCCNTLQYAATLCNTLEATQCNAHEVVTHQNTNIVNANTLGPVPRWFLSSPSLCDTLHTDCNTVQHTRSYHPSKHKWKHSRPHIPLIFVVFLHEEKLVRYDHGVWRIITRHDRIALIFYFTSSRNAPLAVTCDAFMWHELLLVNTPFWMWHVTYS